MSSQLDFAALEDCLKTLNHLYIDINRLKAEAGYETKRGGYGDVQVSRLDSGTAGFKLVAAKRIYLKARHKQPERLAFRLARELKVWARLHHPHVLPVLGYYLDKDLAVLISEYMIHGDLKDYIEQEKPSWDVRMYLIRDTTAGLAYLHAQDPPIRHGDLKTGNVLINAERRAVLADFGLSMTLEDGPTGLTTSDGLKGTLRYYSPEIVAETADCHSLPSDIWAWACLVLEVLADIIPYAEKKSEHSIIKALMNQEPPTDTISLPIPVPAVKHLLARCWTVQPNERPSVDHCLAIITMELSALQITLGVGRDSYQGSNLQSSNFDEDHSSNRPHEDGGWPPAMGSQAGSSPTAIQNRPGVTQGPQGSPQSNGVDGAAFLKLPVEAMRNTLVNFKTKIKALEEQRDRLLQIKTPQMIEQAQRVQAQMIGLQNVMQQLTEVYTRRQAMGLQQAAAGGPSGQQGGQPLASGQGGPMAGGLPNFPPPPPQVQQLFNDPEVMKLSPEELKRRGLNDDIIQRVVVYRQAWIARIIQNRREQEILLQQRQIQVQQAQQAAQQAANLLNVKKETPQMAPGNRLPFGLGGAQPPGLGPAVGNSLQPSALPPQPTVPQLPATLAGLNVSPEQLAKAQEKVRAAIGLSHANRDYSSINLSHEHEILVEQGIHQTQSVLEQVVQNLVAFVVLAPNDVHELNQVAQTVVMLSDQVRMLQKQPPEKRFIVGLGDLNQYRNHLPTFLMRIKGLQSRAMALQSQPASGALPPGPPPPKPPVINFKFALGKKPVPKPKIPSKRGTTKTTPKIPPAGVRGISRPEPKRPQLSKREREDDVASPDHDGSADPSGSRKRVITDPQEDLDAKRAADMAAARQLTIEGSLDFLEKATKEYEKVVNALATTAENGPTEQNAAAGPTLESLLQMLDQGALYDFSAAELPGAIPGSTAAPDPSQEAPALGAKPEEERDDWLWAFDSTQWAIEDPAVGEIPELPSPSRILSDLEASVTEGRDF